MEDGVLIRREDSSISLIVKAAVSFLTGFLLVILLSYIIPPIFSVGEVILPGTDTEAIGWFFLIILFLGVTLLLPSVFIYEALMGQRSWEQENAAINIFIAVMILLTGLLLTYKGWFMLQAIPTSLAGISDVALRQFVTALYWVGTVVAWMEVVIITPIWIIVQSLGSGEQ